MRRRHFIIVVAAIVLAVLGVFFFRVYYPGSQLELKYLGSKMEIPALVDYYKLGMEQQCGVWYGDNRNEQKEVRIANKDALTCFDAAMSKCGNAGVLAISEGLLNKEYSFLRVIGKNVDGKCVIQNSYYYKDDKLDMPETWINTCIKLDDKNIWRSCLPDFLKKK